MQYVPNLLPRVFSDRRVHLVLLAAVVIAAIACRGSGSDPSERDQGLPVVRPTVPQSECVNHIQPEGAPDFEQLDLSLLQAQEEGLRFYDIEVGTGDTPTISDAVSVEYTGWLDNGCMFDTSYLNEGPVTFPLLNVIGGWQRGFVTMQEGGTRVLEIAPSLGYGAIGFPPRIPPDSTLIFHVTLQNRITIAEAQATVEAEIATATAEAANALSETPTPTP